jgi:type I restriction enzyme, S subunit
LKEFETKTIDEVTEVLIDYRGKTPRKTAHGVKLITAKVIKSGRIVEGNHEYVAEDGYESWMRRGLPKQWDILITTEAPLGEVAQLRSQERVALAQRVILLRGKSAIIDQGYYFQALKSPFVRGELHARASGTTVLGIKQSELRKVRIPYFALSVQQKIARMLSAYDDLIENNTRRIRILEDMAQAIYRYWFVHFRFPGHEKVKMVDSSVGRIPSGWEAGQLSDGLLLQRGFDLPSTQRRVGTVPVYAATGAVGTHDEGKVKGPGVITGRSGSLGTVIYIHEDFWPLNTTLWVKEFRRATPAYAFYLLRGLALDSFNSGAAVPTLNRNDIHGLPIVIPPERVLERFDQHIAAFFSMKRNLVERNTKLERARDLLLPKLLAGEIEMDVSAHSL